MAGRQEKRKPSSPGQLDGPNKNGTGRIDSSVLPDGGTGPQDQQEFDLDDSDQLECNLDDIARGKDFYDCLESRDSRLPNWIRRQDKEDLFKHLIVSIDRYNKYLVEKAQTISENQSEIRNPSEIQTAICGAHFQLDGASDRLKQDDIISGLALYNCAREKRVKVLQALDELDGGNRLATFSSNLVEVGKSHLGEEWANRAKESLFEQSDDGLFKQVNGILFGGGGRRNDIRSEDVVPWLREYHSSIDRELASALLVRTILGKFIFFSFISLLAIIAVLEQTEILNSFAPSQNGQVANDSVPVIYRWPFLLLVLFLGMLGSAVNTVRNWPSQLLTLQPRQPRLAITRRLTLARLLFGGIAALFTYLLMIAGTPFIRATSGVIIFVAFTAGFTDQFFTSGVERILESKIESGDLSPRLLNNDDSN